jgi:O-antigen/teichoic acid export membrane protein
LKRTFNSALTHQGFRRYFSNSFWMMGEQLLRMIAGVLVGIWVARYLGPQQFGVFSYALAFVALFGSVAKLGLDSIVVRELVNDADNREIYLGTAFWLKIFGAGITLAVVAIAATFASNSHATNIYILIIACGIVFQSFEVIDFYFQARVLSKFVSISRGIQLLISSLLKIYLVVTGAELFWFVFITLVDQLTLAASLVMAYRLQKEKSFYRHFDWAIAKQMLRGSWPLIFSGLVVMLYMRIDQIMIKEMLGEKEVGIYSAAIRLSEVWYFIPVLITQSLFPAIVSAKKTSEALYLIRLQRLYAFLVWMGILIALPMTFLSNWLVVLLFGVAYSDAGPVLMIHIWTGVFVFLGVASSSWLISEHLQQIALYRTISGLLTNITLNIILIPAYGVIGAAIATVTAQIMAALVFDMFSRKTRATFFMKLKAFNLVYLYNGVKNA